MRYPATIIQCAYSEGAVWARPAVKGWEVVVSYQPTPAFQSPDGGRQERTIPVQRKRDLSREVEAAVQKLLECFQTAFDQCASYLPNEEMEIIIGDGWVEDGEVVQ